MRDKRNHPLLDKQKMRSLAKELSRVTTADWQFVPSDKAAIGDFGDSCYGGVVEGTVGEHHMWVDCEGDLWLAEMCYDVRRQLSVGDIAKNVVEAIRHYDSGEL